MELEGYKSAWQKHSAERHPASPPQGSSPSLQFLRTSSIRDLQRSDETSRLIVSLLFALVAVGASLTLLAPGAGRIAAWLFAVALLVDGLAGVGLLAHRHNETAAANTLEFIRREHSLVVTRLRIERYSQRLMFVLAGLALALLIINPGQPNLHDHLFDPFGRMAVMTAFLAILWRRARSRTKEIRRELELYLEDLEK